VLLCRSPTYVQAPARCTMQVMEVAVSELRANLSAWLDRARQGEEVVVTERGLPVVRLLGISTTAKLERLTGEGVVGRPVQGNRPSAVAGRRPRARRSVADLVSEQRR
jgi:prevent-host-death family protein